MPRNRETPPASDPRRGRNPGYAETEPRDREDARQPPAPKPRHPEEPDEGAIGRDPDTP